MELRIYLLTVLRKWWLVVPAFLVTVTSTIVFTFTQPPIYSATATFVVAPTTAFGDVKSIASGLDILSRRTEIATTYAEVATSRLIKIQAGEALHLTPEQRRSLFVESKLRAGTNVMEITVQGSDPALVQNFANMVGEKTILYVRELYETFDLKPLDEATLPTSPIKPNKRLNIMLGAGFGLILGIGLAFLAEYLQTPLMAASTPGIVDAESGVYTMRYFTQRLGEEMSRAKRNRYPLALALLNVDQLGAMSTLPVHTRSEALRKIALFLKQYLREEDVIGRFGDAVFALLLPDMTEEKAVSEMDKLQTRLAWTPFDTAKGGVKLNLNTAIGVTAYNYNGTGQEEFIAQASQALQYAQAAGYCKVHTFTSSLPPAEET